MNGYPLTIRKQPSGETFWIHVEPSYRISTCKQKIQRMRGIPAGNIRLSVAVGGGTNHSHRIDLQSGDAFQQQTLESLGLTGGAASSGNDKQQHGPCLELAPITLYVRTPTGRRITLKDSIDVEDTVDRVEALVARELEAMKLLQTAKPGNKEPRFRLYYERMPMRRGTPITKYKVKNMDVLKLKFGITNEADHAEESNERQKAAAVRKSEAYQKLERKRKVSPSPVRAGAATSKNASREKDETLLRKNLKHSASESDALKKLERRRTYAQMQSAQTMNQMMHKKKQPPPPPKAHSRHTRNASWSPVRAGQAIVSGIKQASGNQPRNASWSPVRAGQRQESTAPPRRKLRRNTKSDKSLSTSGRRKSPTSRSRSNRNQKEEPNEGTFRRLRRRISGKRSRSNSVRNKSMVETSQPRRMSWNFAGKAKEPDHEPQKPQPRRTSRSKSRNRKTAANQEEVVDRSKRHRSSSKPRTTEEQRRRRRSGSTSKRRSQEETTTGEQHRRRKGRRSSGDAETEAATKKHEAKAAAANPAAWKRKAPVPSKLVQEKLAKARIERSKQAQQQKAKKQAEVPDAFRVSAHKKDSTPPPAREEEEGKNARQSPPSPVSVVEETLNIDALCDDNASSEGSSDIASQESSCASVVSKATERAAALSARDIPPAPESSPSVSRKIPSKASLQEVSSKGGGKAHSRSSVVSDSVSTTEFSTDSELTKEPSARTLTEPAKEEPPPSVRDSSRGSEMSTESERRLRKSLKNTEKSGAIAHSRRDETVSKQNDKAKPAIAKTEKEVTVPREVIVDADSAPEDSTPPFVSSKPEEIKDQNVVQEAKAMSKNEDSVPQKAPVENSSGVSEAKARFENKESNSRPRTRVKKKSQSIVNLEKNKLVNRYVAKIQDNKELHAVPEIFNLEKMHPRVSEVFPSEGKPAAPEPEVKIGKPAAPKPEVKTNKPAAPEPEAKIESDETATQEPAPRRLSVSFETKTPLTTELSRDKSPLRPRRQPSAAVIAKTVKKTKEKAPPKSSMKSQTKADKVTNPLRDKSPHRPRRQPSGARDRSVDKSPLRPSRQPSAAKADLSIARPVADTEKNAKATASSSAKNSAQPQTKTAPINTSARDKSPLPPLRQNSNARATQTTPAKATTSTSTVKKRDPTGKIPVPKGTIAKKSVEPRANIPHANKPPKIPSAPPSAPKAELPVAKKTVANSQAGADSNKDSIVKTTELTSKKPTESVPKIPQTKAAPKVKALAPSLRDTPPTYIPTSPKASIKDRMSKFQADGKENTNANPPASGTVKNVMAGSQAGKKEITETKASGSVKDRIGKFQTAEDQNAKANTPVPVNSQSQGKEKAKKRPSGNVKESIGKFQTGGKESVNATGITKSNDSETQTNGGGVINSKTQGSVKDRIGKFQTGGKENAKPKSPTNIKDRIGKFQTGGKPTNTGFQMIGLATLGLNSLANTSDKKNDDASSDKYSFYCSDDDSEFSGSEVDVSDDDSEFESIHVIAPDLTPIEIEIDPESEKLMDIKQAVAKASGIPLDDLRLAKHNENGDSPILDDDFKPRPGDILTVEPSTVVVRLPNGSSKLELSVFPGTLLSDIKDYIEESTGTKKSRQLLFNFHENFNEEMEDDTPLSTDCTLRLTVY